MSNVCLVFPGQGSQYVGMGLQLSNNFNIAKRVFEEVDDILNYKLSNIIFNGDEAELSKTQNTQPAIFANSIAIWKVLQTETEFTKQHNINYLAGHSLGEYSAMVVSECMTFEDAIKTLFLRGTLMSKYSSNNSGMLAVLGASEEQILNIIHQVSENDKILSVANNNCPGQIVISGHLSQIERFITIANENSIKKTIKLPVQGAFHSSMMIDAQREIESHIMNLKLSEPKIPVFQNKSNSTSNNTDTIKRNLVEQITSQVNWTAIIQNITNLNINHFVEIGPKNVLTNLIKRINKDLIAENIEIIA